MNYGEALELLKAGKLVARKGWNGKRMFIFMRPGDTIPSTVFFSAISIPEPVKRYYRSINPVDYVVTPYLCMKAADETIVNGWLASQTDMLADDWEEFVV